MEEIKRLELLNTAQVSLKVNLQSSCHVVFAEGGGASFGGKPSEVSSNFQES